MNPSRHAPSRPRSSTLLAALLPLACACSAAVGPEGTVEDEAGKGDLTVWGADGEGASERVELTSTTAGFQLLLGEAGVFEAIINDVAHDGIDAGDSLTLVLPDGSARTLSFAPPRDDVDFVAIGASEERPELAIDFRELDDDFRSGLAAVDEEVTVAYETGTLVGPQLASAGGRRSCVETAGALAFRSVPVACVGGAAAAGLTSAGIGIVPGCLVGAGGTFIGALALGSLMCWAGI